MGYFDRPKNSMFGYGYAQAPIPPRKPVLMTPERTPRTLRQKIKVYPSKPFLTSKEKARIKTGIQTIQRTGESVARKGFVKGKQVVQQIQEGAPIGKAKYSSFWDRFKKKKETVFEQ